MIMPTAAGALLSLSKNYRGDEPFTLFLALIDYEDVRESAGARGLAELMEHSGYLELSALGAALTEYAQRPDVVTEWLGTL